MEVGLVMHLSFINMSLGFRNPTTIQTCILSYIMYKDKFKSSNLGFDK